MKLSPPAKRMVAVILASSLVLTAGGALYYRSLMGTVYFALAVFAVAALNILKVVMLERAVLAAVESADDPEDLKVGRNRFRLQYLFRLLLTALVLVGAALLASSTGYASLWGAVAGLLAWQVAAYSTKFMKHAGNTDVPASSTDADVPGDSEDAEGSENE